MNHVIAKTFLAAILLAITACTPHAANPLALPQGTPRHGLAAYFNAHLQQNAEAIRQCLYVTPAHQSLARDAAITGATLMAFQIAANNHFPDKKNNFISVLMTPEDVQDELRHIADQEVNQYGSHANLHRLPASSNGLASVIWQMINDHGQWKIDVESMWALKNDSLNSDSHGQFQMLIDACPDLQSITTDLNNARITTPEQLKTRVDAAFRAANAKAVAREKAGRLMPPSTLSR